MSGNQQVIQNSGNENEIQADVDDNNCFISRRVLSVNVGKEENGQ
jgi:hypothetical protein